MKTALCAVCVLALFSGCASSRFLVSNPNRDIYADVSVNGSPVATELSTGHVEGSVPSGASVTIRAVTYRIRENVRQVIDSIMASLRIESDSDLRVKVDKDGLINTYASPREAPRAR